MQNLVKMTSTQATNEEIEALLKFLVKKYIVENEDYQEEFGEDTDGDDEMETYFLLKKLQKSVTKIVLETPQNTNTYFQFLTVFVSAEPFVANPPETIDIQNMLFQKVDNTFIDVSKLSMNPIF